ncbi:MAG TPA: carboxypeptidase M32 [Bacillota bacterium]|nr:carboxypeptidase M32 [Bacillota bacterium]
MEKSLETWVAEFKEHTKKIAYYQNALGILYWDSRTNTPKKGQERESEVIGFLSTQVYQLTVSADMDQFLDVLSKDEHLRALDPATAKSVREYRKENERMKKIPPEMYEEYVVLTAKAESIWEDAKKNNDFKLFELYLTKIVDFNRKFAKLWGYQEHPYDALLDPYEPGMTVDILDKLFADLRQSTVTILKRIQNSGHPVNTEIFNGKFSVARQEAIGRYLLEEIGFDFAAGTLHESEHPFTGGANHRGDVRLTTHYYENDIRSSIFSCIHEGGHGIYEQNITADLIDTPLGTGTSMGVHESQSRFYENRIGRSRSFWQRYYPKVQEYFPETFTAVSLDDFYRGVNCVTPSLVRVEADELTYNLHIILRYEIEKALIEGSCQVTDLPQIWGDKMEEYLGVRPRTDAEGVLQDVHWSGGSFGYFPSYSIGNIYSAQFAAAMERDGLNLDLLIEQGDFAKIRQWLGGHIHYFGKLKTPAEILQDATGESIDASYLIKYFEKKYGEIYGI